MNFVEQKHWFVKSIQDASFECFVVNVQELCQSPEIERCKIRMMWEQFILRANLIESEDQTRTLSKAFLNCLMSSVLFKEYPKALNSSLTWVTFMDGALRDKRNMADRTLAWQILQHNIPRSFGVRASMDLRRRIRGDGAASLISLQVTHTFLLHKSILCCMFHLSLLSTSYFVWFSFV